MVFLSLSSRFNRSAGPLLLRWGLSARFALGRGTVRDNPMLDAALLIPWAQKLISLEAHEDYANKDKEPSALDKFVDRTFDRFFGADAGSQTDSAATIDNRKKGDKQDHGSITNFRLETLERYLRPALVPNERWSDVLRWHFHFRVLEWLRREFIIAKHGEAVKQALQAYPDELLPVLQRQRKSARRRWSFQLPEFLQGQARKDATRNRSHGRLPSASKVRRAFGMERWSTQINTEAEWFRLSEITKKLGGSVLVIQGQDFRFPGIDPDTDISTLSLEDLLELTGQRVAYSGPLNAFCEEADLLELWTKDYVQSLAAYLLDRDQTFDGQTSVLILGRDTFALAGILKQFLKIEVKQRSSPKAPSIGRRRSRVRPQPQRGPSIQQSTLDVHQLTINSDGRSHGQLSTLMIEESISKHAGNNEKHQLIMVCSWMPSGEDWTHSFISAGVDEYILIGDDEKCGDDWLTWAKTEGRDDDEGITQDPPHVVHGFVRRDLCDLSKLHFCRFDSAVSKHGRTVSFKKYNVNERRRRS